jgi:hypothetical protein
MLAKWVLVAMRAIEFASSGQQLSRSSEEKKREPMTRFRGITANRTPAKAAKRTNQILTLAQTPDPVDSPMS